MAARVVSLLIWSWTSRHELPSSEVGACGPVDGGVAAHAAIATARTPTSKTRGDFIRVISPEDYAPRPVRRAAGRPRRRTRRVPRRYRPFGPPPAGCHNYGHAFDRPRVRAW